MSGIESASEASNLSFERERGVYALQVTRDVAHAVIVVGDDSQRTNRLLQVFRALADADIAIFLTKLHRTAVTLAFAGADSPRVESAIAATGMKATPRRDLAILTVLAASMRDLSGVMVEIADALYSAGARLYETGDSHNSVQCLIEDSKVAATVAALCQTFHLDASAVSETSVETEAA